MERDAMVLYLRDVRDLEVVKHCTAKAVRQQNEQVNKRVAQLQRDEHEAFTPGFCCYDRGDWLPYLGVSCLMIGFPVLLVWGMITTDDPGIIEDFLTVIIESFLGGWVAPVLFAIGIGLVVVGAISLILFPLLCIQERVRTARSNAQRRQEVDEHNRKVDAERPARLQEAAKLQEDWQARRAELVSQHKKASAQLRELYDLNILAAPYRSLTHVAYIYEYMSTSQATLEETLLHEHMEDGFKRMEKKLDNVAHAVWEHARETSALRAQHNAAQLKSDRADRALLESLQRNEANTAEAARYARLNAEHGNALVFLETVDFLKK